MMLFLLVAAALEAAAPNATKPKPKPTGPKPPRFSPDYSAVIEMSLPYMEVKMPIKVNTIGTEGRQRLDYFDGLQTTVQDGELAYRHIFSGNAKKVCYLNLGDARRLEEVAPSRVRLAAFLPDLSAYRYAGQEVINGQLCEKWAGGTKGKAGSRDNNPAFDTSAFAFYFDRALSKPVRWLMRGRTIDYLFYEAFTGNAADVMPMDLGHGIRWMPEKPDVSLPQECQNPANLVRQPGMVLTSPLEAGHASIDHTHFEAFALSAGKAYETEEQKEARKDVFADNAQLLRELNERFAGAATFRGGPMMDLTHDEFLAVQGTGFRPGPMDSSHEGLLAAPRTRARLPKQMDWRKTPGVVGAVKNQGACGSCWAFSLVGAVEGRLALSAWEQRLEKNAKPKPVTISEQFVVDCSWNTTTVQGCSGGDMKLATMDLIKKGRNGLPTDASYGPYQSVDGYCKQTGGAKLEQGAELVGWVDVPHRDDKALMSALQSGPVSVALSVPPPMRFYATGVLDIEECTDYNASHAVVLVGYGTELVTKNVTHNVTIGTETVNGTTVNVTEERTEAKTEQVDYWLLRNSWSEDWGDKGYFKVARGERDCGISGGDFKPGYPVLSRENGVWKQHGDQDWSFQQQGNDLIV